jgi:hypothetical protein
LKFFIKNCKDSKMKVKKKLKFSIIKKINIQKPFLIYKKKIPE